MLSRELMCVTLIFLTAIVTFASDSVWDAHGNIVEAYYFIHIKMGSFMLSAHIDLLAYLDDSLVDVLCVWPLIITHH